MVQQANRGYRKGEGRHRTGRHQLAAAAWVGGSKWVVGWLRRTKFGSSLVQKGEGCRGREATTTQGSAADTEWRLRRWVGQERHKYL